MVTPWRTSVGAVSSPNLPHRLDLQRAVEQGVANALNGRLQELQRESEAQAARRHQELLDAMRAWERRQRRDIFTALDQEAARSSAELLRSELQGASLHGHPHATLRHALQHAPEDGLALEFGVATGTTLRIIAEHGRHSVFGFDSFAGLPERWRLGYEVGTFATDALPDVPGAELVVGLFADTLPGFLAEHAGPVSFLHVDCDLYASTRTVLELVGPRLVEGTVIAFDEYYNFPGWQDHEYRAWAEYVEQTDLRFEYLGLTMDDEQVTVRVTRPPVSAERSKRPVGA